MSFPRIVPGRSDRRVWPSAAIAEAQTGLLCRPQMITLGATRIVRLFPGDENHMSERPHSLHRTKSRIRKLDKKAVREAILRLRRLTANLPPNDAATMVRAIREATPRQGS